MLFKKVKLIITIFSLLIVNLVSWASELSAELKIINKTKNYYVQAYDIKVYFSEGGSEMAQSDSIPPGGHQDMSWFNKWLNWKSEKRHVYSTLKLSVWKGPIKSGKFISIKLDQRTAEIEKIPIKIEDTQCYTTPRTTETIEYCDYTITVGTGSE